MHDLFVKMQNPDHCLYQLLPPERSTTNSLRERGHSFELYEYNYKFFRQSFVVNCLLCDVFFYFSYHYKLPFDVYAYTFDMCNSKFYLLTYQFMHNRALVIRLFCDIILSSYRTVYLVRIYQALVIHLPFVIQYM